MATSKFVGSVAGPDPQQPAKEFTVTTLLGVAERVLDRLRHDFPKQPWRLCTVGGRGDVDSGIPAVVIRGDVEPSDDDVTIVHVDGSMLWIDYRDRSTRRSPDPRFHVPGPKKWRRIERVLYALAAHRYRVDRRGRFILDADGERVVLPSNQKLASLLAQPAIAARP